MQPYEHGGACGDPNIILDFSVSLNPLGMPPAVRTAIADGISGFDQYPDPDCRALRGALSARHGTDPSMILCGNGASELIFALCAALKPRRALIPAPTFSEYGRSVELFGGRIAEHPLFGREGFALTRRILADLTPETEVLFLCNPNNPTGRLIDAELMADILNLCRQNGVVLVMDECFLNFTEGESLLPLLAGYPNLLVLRAFTKLYAMAGLRLGALYCGDAGLLARIARFCPAWHVSAVAQTAGLAALQVRGWAEETRRFVAAERAHLTAELTELGLAVGPGEGNFLLIRSRAPLWESLKERGILTRNCSNFSGLDERHIRVGLKKREENQALIAAIREVLHG